MFCTARCSTAYFQSDRQREFIGISVSWSHPHILMSKSTAISQRWRHGLYKIVAGDCPSRSLPMHQIMRLMTLSQRGDTDDSHAAHLLLHRPQSCTRHLCHVVLMVLRNGWCAATRYMISSHYALKIWRLRYR